MQVFDYHPHAGNNRIIEFIMQRTHSCLKTDAKVRAFTPFTNNRQETKTCIRDTQLRSIQGKQS